MSFEHEPEAVTSAAYHADTDDEYDFKTNDSDEGVIGEEGGNGDTKNNHRNALLLKKKNLEAQLKEIERALCQAEPSDQSTTKDCKTSSQSAVMDYGADTDHEDFAASPVDKDINECRPNNQEVCEEAEDATTGRTVPSRKRKQLSLEEDDRPPERAARKRSNGKKDCSADGCTNQAKAGGVCIRHGAKSKRCSKEGCTNKAQRGGVCMKHGAKVERKLCSSEGCINVVVNRGVCVRHGAKSKRCSKEGCTKFAQRGGLCIRHGAKVKQCSSEGCTNNALKGGVCIRHGAKIKRCRKDGCTNKALKGGVCMKHGAKKKLCSKEGCTNYAQKRGLCKRHGAYKGVSPDEANQRSTKRFHRSHHCQRSS